MDETELENAVPVDEVKQELGAVEKDEAGAEGSIAVENDPYFYTKRGDYTSELFKVEIRSLPKFVNYATFKKLFKNKLKIVPQKIKLIGTKFAFVALKSEADKKSTLEQLDGYIWKGSKLVVTSAKPAADPYISAKRKEADQQERSGKDKKLKGDSEQAEQPIVNATELLNDKSAPLWRLSYDEQLEQKSQTTREFLQELHKDIGKVMDSKKYLDMANLVKEGQEDPLKISRKLLAWYMNAKNHNDRMACTLSDIRRSPDIAGYRGKCEFSVGPDKTVGFRVGAYKDGSVTVANVDECPIVSDVMKKVCRAFERFMKEVTQLGPYDNITHEGHWKQLTVRSTRDGQCMAIAIFFPQKLTLNEIEEQKVLLKDFLASQTDVDVTSLYFQVYAKKEQNARNEENNDFLTGQTHLTECMHVADRALKFRISPKAFFQSNASAAEVCYQTLCDLIDANKNTILLDICCGTGTIGICLASKVKHVIGIELNAEAIEDAKVNAQINDIINIEFIKGKAESTVPAVVAKLQARFGDVNVVAIIDPPRAGLNASVMKALRATEGLQKLLYVSCEPRIAKHNLIDLCRPPSKAYRGDAFVPTQAIPVDMFPHTKHCEVIFVYERLSSLKDTTSTTDCQANASEVPTTEANAACEVPLSTSEIKTETA